ncbi:MAG TPA: metallophosphoesterase [Bacteroidota bacterium]|nr:metallophosphoesterase [Bacteroidota bacterium]
MFWAWAVWIAIVIGVLSIAYFFVSARLVGTSHLSPAGKHWVRVAVAVLLLVPMLSMILFRYLEGLPTAISWAIHLGLGFLSFVVTLLAIREVAWLGFKGFDFLRSLATSSSLVDPSRRDFLLHTSNLVVLGAAGVLTAYGVYEARRRPGIVNITVPIRRLPQAFNGFRIVQITDIHAGLTLTRPWIETVAQEVAELRPDLIAFTGDLADGSVGYLREHVAPLAQLHAPAGKFFVTGNHEYYSGAEPWVKEAERMGYRVLLNEHQIISRNGASIVLAGITDYIGGDFLPHHTSDPMKALDGAPADVVRILLAHQPRSLYTALPLGFDLQI